ncbi:type 1 glutamine amidotransferase family protein [Litoreibacter arenae]|uniref:Uncharacterized protein n=1 Tax=Litoreibacter arenae DSM 19593 TaxID=1123360 RepID=S9RWA4_9RHOB|nr:hypothetical protein [Litoreibacter arenae]EPX78294.1 hypothetical protein thalar_02523 [Litoreibacter arenae DSM 19593]
MTVAQIRKHVRFGGKVEGICTGAATLARVGLLQDRIFTLHQENQPVFVENTLTGTANLLPHLGTARDLS